VETAVHQLVEDRFRVRVAAVLEALASLAPGVGIALGGVLTASFSPRLAYLFAGAGLTVLVAFGIMRRPGGAVQGDAPRSGYRSAPSGSG
jgi:hypothetical protein